MNGRSWNWVLVVAVVVLFGVYRMHAAPVVKGGFSPATFAQDLRHPGDYRQWVFQSQKGAWIVESVLRLSKDKPDASMQVAIIYIYQGSRAVHVQSIRYQSASGSMETSLSAPQPALSAGGIAYYTRGWQKLARPHQTDAAIVRMFAAGSAAFVWQDAGGVHRQSMPVR